MNINKLKNQIQYRLNSDSKTKGPSTIKVQDNPYQLFPVINNPQNGNKVDSQPNMSLSKYRSESPSIRNYLDTVENDQLKDTFYSNLNQLPGQYKHLTKQDGPRKDFINANKNFNSTRKITITPDRYMKLAPIVDYKNIVQNKTRSKSPMFLDHQNEVINIINKARATKRNGRNHMQFIGDQITRQEFMPQVIGNQFHIEKDRNNTKYVHEEKIKGDAIKTFVNRVLSQSSI